MTIRSGRAIFLAGTVAGILAASVAGYWARQVPTVGASAARQPIAEPAAAPGHHAADSTSGTQPGQTVDLSPEEITAAGVQVAEVKTARLKADIEAFGRVEQPEAQLAVISTRIGGRIDKLLVQYTGQTVRRGQPVAELYSPEVANAAAEYHLASQYRNRLNQGADAESIAQADALEAASRRKLELWGVTAKQAEAEDTGSTPHVTIYSSATGTVVDRKATQGQYVAAGDTLFTVADLSHVWIKADVYESQLPGIHPGQSVDVTSDALPNLTIHGRVDFIEPTANPLTRTVPVHVHVANPGMRLVPGMFVRAELLGRSAEETVVVPRSAVLDTGTRKIVYVASGPGSYEAREVEIGAPSDDLFPVTRGLKRGEKIVLAGNFLIDSQTRLSAGMSGLYGGSKEFGPGHDAGAPTESTAKISYRIVPEQPKAENETQVEVSLLDKDGKSIPDAQVAVSFVMSAMPSMNMPEMRNEFALRYDAARQQYSGSGRIPMAGSWNVIVTATKGGQAVGNARGRLTAR